MKGKSPVSKICGECGSTELIRDLDTGELVCERCGYVVSSTLIDQGPEWRTFNIEQRNRLPRAGSPITLTIHDRGISTIIDWRDRDSHGRRLKPAQKARVYRLRKWHRRSRVSGASQRSLSFALSEIVKFAHKLNIPKSAIETASMIYRRIVRERLIRGRSIRGMAAASVYIACRKCGITRSIEDVARAANISKKVCGRNYRHLLRKMDVSVPPVNPQMYVSKFVSKLALSGDAESIALDLLDLAAEMRLTNGRGPTGMAAACTYIAGLLTDDPRTQGEIAREASVTEVTIRNRYKELANELEIRIEL